MKLSREPTEVERSLSGYDLVIVGGGLGGAALARATAEADARRARAFPLFAQDRTRVPDHIFCGPDLPIDATTKSRFWGEE